MERYSGRPPRDPNATGTEIVLVSMPFAPANLPSIGLSLLKATLSPLRISTRIFYATLRFAQLVGHAHYTLITDGVISCSLVGDWLFSEALFGPGDVDGYVENILSAYKPDGKNRITDREIRAILETRGEVNGFLDQCENEILDLHPRIVGFTSIFEQHVASLALARRLKERRPELFILFGGSNCEGIMGVETVRQFPFVDAAVSGEAEVVFPELVERVLSSRPVSGLGGVLTRDKGEGSPLSEGCLYAPAQTNMDSLPYPEYGDFLEQLAATDLESQEGFRPRLTFETSRGCWWGEKSHCTFCGLNGLSMTHRSKSSARAMDELTHLIDSNSAYFSKYPRVSIQIVDNILDMRYFDDFVPQLAERKLDVTLFYETKANLKKEQIRLLRDARIDIQPGIESLSSDVLKLMRKGVKGLQNIQLLKWCKELGVRPWWNFLWGFPGESPAEYERMAKMIPLLTHLQPPLYGIQIMLHRFSPNFDHAEEFGFTQVAPFPSYFYVYPLSHDAVSNLAYHFTFSYRDPQPVEEYTAPVIEQIDAWRDQYESSELFAVDTGSELEIWDLRSVANRRVTVIEEPQRSLYLACDRVCSTSHLIALVEQYWGRSVPAGEVEQILKSLIDQKLMVREGNSYLGLAVLCGEYRPPVLARRLAEDARQEQLERTHAQSKR